MKKNISLPALLFVLFFFLFNKKADAQTATHYLSSKVNNFSTFTNSYKAPGKKWLKNNSGFSNHPDAGFLTGNDPKPGAIEVFAKRTYNSKYFIDGDSASKFYIIKASDAINYLKNGQWLSIDKRLRPKGAKLFEASHQQEPVGFDADKKIAYIKTLSGIFYFNDWKLSGKNKTGETTLAKADWTNISAGDDGIKIINIFPGIDAEMIVDKGAVKTNFIVKEDRFTGYDQLLFIDQLRSSATTDLFFEDGKNEGEEQAAVNFSINNKIIARINKAMMYPQNSPVKNFQPLAYKIEKNNLSIIVDVNTLNKQLAKGQLIIDPLVTAIDSLVPASIAGSMSNCSRNIQTCNYSLQMQTPAKATVTGVSFQFGYNAYSPAEEKDGDFSITTGTCTSGDFSVDPNGASIDEPGTVSTMGQWADISSLINCFPSASCTAKPVTFTLEFFNTYCGNASGCSNEYVGAEEALQILIEGHTLEIDSTNGVSSVIATPSTICQNANSILNSSGAYGVQPYIYSWSNGAGNGSNVVVSPATTTTYTITVTDQCGSKATGNVTVNVNPGPPTPSISSNSAVCQGSALNLITPAAGNITYNWTGPNGFSSNVQDPVIVATTAAANGTYSLIVTQQNGCTSAVATTNVAITVPAIPTVTITTPTQTICPAASATFTASAANGGAAPSYQWFLNGTAAGTNSATYTANNLADGDKVNCILTSNAACIASTSATSNTITITISQNIAPAISIVASADTICNGTQIVFTATPLNSSSPSYQWKLNGNNVGADQPTYTTSSLINNDVISCVLTNNSSCFGVSTATSNNIQVTVNQATMPSVTIVSSTNNICAGNPVTFTATPVNAGVSPFFQWQINGVAVGGNDPAYTTNTLANGDNVTCRLTVSNTGCYTIPNAISNAITMIIEPVPAITLTADTVIMKGDSTKINSAIAGSYTRFLWTPSIGLVDPLIIDPIADPLETTTYQLSVTGTDGCETSKDITIQVFTKVYVPNAFTPNGDGINDVFRIPPGVVFSLTNLSVFDRWGNKVFETSDISKGWDGTYNGTLSPTGTYVYFITGSSTNKKVFVKGTVMLIR